MKSLLTIELLPGMEIITQKGSKIKVGEPLAKKPLKVFKEKIPLSKILSIPPKKIISYLCRRLGTSVKKGEILAKKEGVLKNIHILSPRSGFIDSVDLKDGTLLLVSETDKEQIEKSPINGFVESITENQIVISFEGKVFCGEKGKGERIVSQTLTFENKVDMFDFASEVKDKIIIAKTITDGARAKLVTLGAVALVASEYYEDFPAMVVLSEKQLIELKSSKKGNIIILGEKKQVIIPLEW